MGGLKYPWRKKYLQNSDNRKNLKNTKNSKKLKQNYKSLRAALSVWIWLPLLKKLPHNIKISICQALKCPFAQDSTYCCNRDMVWNPRNLLCRDHWRIAKMYWSHDKYLFKKIYFYVFNPMNLSNLLEFLLPGIKPILTRGV